MKAHDHPLFKQFPLDGSATLSTGRVPTPYHVYDGHGVFLGGVADLDAVQNLLRREQLHAVCNDRGQALMGVWVFDFKDASLGAHHELQLSMFVSEQPLAPVDAHPLALLELMVTRPEVRMLCHGLWNNRPQVVAYNRELLALDARPSRSRIEHDAHSLRFVVDDADRGERVVEGCVHRARRASWAANLSLAARLGLRRLVALARQPWLHVPVINPVGTHLPRNAAADSFTRADRSALRYFDAPHDHLVFSDPTYRALDFRAQFSQFMSGFKFVYLQPR